MAGGDDLKPIMSPIKCCTQRDALKAIRESLIKCCAGGDGLQAVRTARFSEAALSSLLKDSVPQEFCIRARTSQAAEKVGCAKVSYQGTTSVVPQRVEETSGL